MVRSYIKRVALRRCLWLHAIVRPSRIFISQPKVKSPGAQSDYRGNMGWAYVVVSLFSRARMWQGSPFGCSKQIACSRRSVPPGIGRENWQRKQASRGVPVPGNAAYPVYSRLLHVCACCVVLIACGANKHSLRALKTTNASRFPAALDHEPKKPAWTLVPPSLSVGRKHVAVRRESLWFFGA